MTLTPTVPRFSDREHHTAPVEIDVGQPRRVVDEHFRLRCTGHAGGVPVHRRGVVGNADERPPHAEGACTDRDAEKLSGRCADFGHLLR